MNFFDTEFSVYIMPFVISTILGIYIVPKMRLLGHYRQSGVMSYTRSLNKSRMMIGGIPIFPVMLISFCTILSLPRLLALNDLAGEIQASVLRILQVTVGLSTLYIIGIKDDINGTSTKNKFIGLLFANLLLPASGLWINNLHGLLGLYAIPDWAGMPLTVVVGLYITIVFVLLDGIDGLSSGLSAVSFAIFAILSWWKGFAIAGIISSAALGIVLPFWVMKIRNRQTRKTILGSSGSFIIGYTLAYLTIGLSRQGGGALPENMLIICFSVIMIPALDILRVLRSRIRDSRALLNADKNQLNHKLIRTGLHRTGVIISLLFLTLFFVGITVSMVVIGINQNIILITDLLLYVILQFVLNYFIERAKNHSFYRNWNKVYGEKAWNADIPKEKLRKKQNDYGTMGLPARIVQGNALTFIPDGMNSFERNIKRLIDFMIATCCLIVFSPLFLLSYILIKLDDGGPAIYKQERIGRFGRPFKILKYRSMRLDAEKFGPALSHSGGDDDPRLTKVGKFLRAHHLDELPQLWNVFTGDMAFIGYRPERKFFIDQIMEIDPRYAFLYQIRPGVTSYATLYNGYTDTMEKMLRRLELDLYYLGHRSWWLDMKVLFLTFTNIVGGKKF